METIFIFLFSPQYPLKPYEGLPHKVVVAYLSRMISKFATKNLSTSSAFESSPMSLFSYLYLLNPKTIFHSMALVYRSIALAVYLENNEIHCRITKFLRRRETAHRWSTAHHIVNGRIKIGALRKLKDGRDRDGNLWYRQDWDTGYDDEASASKCEPIKINAIKLGSPQTVYAEEGYESGDTARLPNLQDIPISKHVFGLAIDIKVDWNKLGGPWSDHAQKVVTKFGLARPVEHEEWHFELIPGTLLAINHYIVVPPHKVAIWLMNWVARNWKSRNYRP